MSCNEDRMVAAKKKAQRISYILDESFYLVLAIMKLMAAVFGYISQGKTDEKYDSAKKKFEEAKKEALKSAKNLLNIGEERFEQYISSLEPVQIDTFDSSEEWINYFTKLNELGLKTDTQWIPFD